MPALKTERQKRLIKKLALVVQPTLSVVQSATLALVLESEARRPLRGGAKDLQHDGLFGDGHKQKELF